MASRVRKHIASGLTEGCKQLDQYNPPWMNRPLAHAINKPATDCHDRLLNISVRDRLLADHLLSRRSVGVRYDHKTLLGCYWWEPHGRMSAGVRVTSTMFGRGVSGGSEEPASWLAAQCYPMRWCLTHWEEQRHWPIRRNRLRRSPTWPVKLTDRHGQGGSKVSSSHV